MPSILLLTCDVDVSLKEVFDDYGEVCGYVEAAASEECHCIIVAGGEIGVVRHDFTCTVWGRSLLACLVSACVCLGQSRACLPQSVCLSVSACA